MIGISGPAAEELICGSITDHGDRIDQQMARDYLRERYANARLEQQFVRMQLAAERLVPASRNQIEIVAAVLLKRTSLTGDEIIAQLNGATEPVSWV
jgi:hypothetical protein